MLFAAALLASGSSLPSAISWTKTHKWLGLLWNPQGDLSLHVRQCCGSCHSIVQALCGLVKGQRIPLALACFIFDCKVESSLRFGHWLWGVQAKALASLSDAYSSWARMLVGASRWRSAEVCRSELGWSLCAQAEVVIDVACARQSLWMQSDSSLAGVCLLAPIYWVPGTGLFPHLSCLTSGLSLIGRFGLLAGGSTPSVLSMLRPLRGWLLYSVGVQLWQGIPVPSATCLSHLPRPLSCVMPSNVAFRSGHWWATVI